MWVYNDNTLLSCCGKDSQTYFDTPPITGESNSPNGRPGLALESCLTNTKWRKACPRVLRVGHKKPCSLGPLERLLLESWDTVQEGCHARDYAERGEGEPATSSPQLCPHPGGKTSYPCH